MAAIAVSVPVEAPGYRFVPDGDEQAVLAADATRWSPAVWGSGQTLAWHIAAGPGWFEAWVDGEGASHESRFTSLSEVESFVREGLEFWSSIPSADIQWDVAGFEEDAGGVQNGVNEVRVRTESEPGFENGGSFIRHWFRMSGSRRQVVECDIIIHPRRFRSRNLDEGLYVLVHELGHCLPLAHADVLPTWNARMTALGHQDVSEMYAADPVMSYGWWGPFITHDDRIGASLLRPAPRWLESTGSIAGAVRVGAAPARFIRVVGTRLDGGRLAESVGSFTSTDGTFAIEGLPPGEYLLSAGPTLSSSAHRRHPGMTLQMDDQFVLTPVTVIAGQTTTVATIHASGARHEVTRQ